MKYLNHLALASIVLVAATLIAVQTTRGDEPSKTPATGPSTQPINKMCAVERDDEVNPEYTTVYQGKVIGFCCEDCMPKFKKDPEKYMKGLK